MLKFNAKKKYSSFVLFLNRRRGHAQLLEIDSPGFLHVMFIIKHARK